MNQLGKTKTLSKEERKQIKSLLEKYSKKDLEMALRQLIKKQRVRIK